jgi:hypothetical protein
MNFEKLKRWISISIVEVEQTWCLRASDIIFDWKMTAIVYMSDTVDDNWIVKNIRNAADYLRGRRLGLVTIIA